MLTIKHAPKRMVTVQTLIISPRTPLSLHVPSAGDPSINYPTQIFTHVMTPVEDILKSLKDCGVEMTRFEAEDGVLYFNLHPEIPLNFMKLDGPDDRTCIHYAMRNSEPFIIKLKHVNFVGEIVAARNHYTANTAII